MSDELLPYYQRELSFIRRMGAEFAQAHPEDAARLRLSAETCDDPHVERMIEAFAFLTARIRHKLDDDFPEITAALLSVLYPHYLAPIPSMAIVEMVLDKGQAGLVAGYAVPPHTMIETEPVDGRAVQFRTCYPTRLFPIEVVSAKLGSVPFTTGTPIASGASTLLRIELRCLAPDVTFGKLQLDRLRFYLKGQAPHALGMYELLFNSAVQVTLGNVQHGAKPVALGPQRLRQVGLGADEGMLPYSQRSFPGYRLLTEYFAFPQKFLFFDIADLDHASLANLGQRVELCIYFDRAVPELEPVVTGDMFRLGCTPLINLFPQRAEPIRLTQTQTEYPVIPDARWRMALEVHSIEKVIGSGPDSSTAEFLPFYSFKHAIDRHAHDTFWYATRRPGGYSDGRFDPGTEVSLSFVDLDYSPATPADWVIDVETICLNRDLPHRLPFGGGQPRLRLSAGGPLSSIVCLTPPTPTLRPNYRNAAMWRVISHLSLNHLSITERLLSSNGNGVHGNGRATSAPDALREILKLYDFAATPATQAQIAGILEVKQRRAVGRAGGAAAGGFCRGIEVDVLFDDQAFADNGLFLFACVLERFLALYGSINSFTRLTCRSKQRQGVLRQWPPRAAERIVL